MRINLIQEKKISLTRDSNMELLRIVSMFFIVLHHLLVHGLRGVVGNRDYYELTQQAGIPTMIDGFLIVGVNVFVLISGYYGIKTKFKGLLRLYIQCFSYGLVLYLLDKLTQHQPISLNILKNSIFILSNSPWWFVTQYVFLYLLAPLLNKAISAIDKKGFIYILILLTILNVYFGYLWGSSFNSNGYSFMNFTYLYIIGRYIQLYVKRDSVNIKKVKMKYLVLYSILSLVLGLLALLLYHFKFIHLSYRIWYYNNPIIILTSVILLIFFSSLNLNSKMINFLAKSCLAVYLIQDGLFSGRYIYMFADKVYLRIQENIGEFVAVISLFIIALMILFLSIFIDKIRMLITNPIENSINKYWVKFRLKYIVNILN